MFRIAVSRCAAVAIVAVCFAQPGVTIGAPTSHVGFASNVRAPMSPLYRDVNFRFVPIGEVLHECYDVEVSHDYGATWEFVETVCNPV